ncbi:hypothetical protein DID77_03465 [Candidatus Marinamargulisbacteria bacterium SCGC AG-439-L15]|nr:hypothetical protein DID77_03465 [Candidatus Marinamargulisbacteria bacterium SCGC AG-439-L15]
MNCLYSLTCGWFRYTCPERQSDPVDNDGGSSTLAKSQEEGAIVVRESFVSRPTLTLRDVLEAPDMSTFLKQHEKSAVSKYSFRPVTVSSPVVFNHETPFDKISSLLIRVQTQELNIFQLSRHVEMSDKLQKYQLIKGGVIMRENPQLIYVSLSCFKQLDDFCNMLQLNQESVLTAVETLTSKSFSQELKICIDDKVPIFFIGDTVTEQFLGVLAYYSEANTVRCIMAPSVSEAVELNSDQSIRQISKGALVSTFDWETLEGLYLKRTTGVPLILVNDNSCMV